MLSYEKCLSLSFASIISLIETSFWLKKLCKTIGHFSGCIMSTNVDSVFEGTVDFYRGVTVKTSKEKCLNVEEFSTKLTNSLKKWTDDVSLKKTVLAEKFYFLWGVEIREMTGSGFYMLTPSSIFTLLIGRLQKCLASFLSNVTSWFKWIMFILNWKLRHYRKNRKLIFYLITTNCIGKR